VLTARVDSEGTPIGAVTLSTSHMPAAGAAVSTAGAAQGGATGAHDAQAPGSAPEDGWVLLPSFDASQASVATGGIASTAVSVGQQQQQQQQQPAAAATAAPILFLPVEGQLLRRFSAQMRMGLRDLHAVVSASPRRRSTDKARALN
jgi:hypothetical protein